MPIIKSKGRKDRDYKQLVEYMFQHDHEQENSFTYLHNMFDKKEDDIDGIITNLTDNISLLKKRKGGVGMYHEMISFSPMDTTYLKDHPEILEDIAEQYMELRAGNRIGLAKPHYDKDHIHIHCCFTPNGVGEKKTSRLSKTEFQHIRCEIEKYQLSRYPELHHSYVHIRDADQSKDIIQSPSEWGMTQRGQKSDKKYKISTRVTNAINDVNSIEAIDSSLRDFDLQPYYRNDVLQGILVDGRKYRLTTLLKHDPVLLGRIKTLLNAEKRQKLNRRLER